MELDSYFKDLKKDVDFAYEVAGEARGKGKDPDLKVECPLALTMAERAVNLVKVVYPALNVSKVSASSQRVPMVEAQLKEVTRSLNETKNLVYSKT